MHHQDSLKAWCEQNGKEQILQQWDYENNKCGPADVYYRTKQKYHWLCEKEPEHRWTAAPARRTRHKSTQCPFCSGRFLVPAVNSLAACAPKLADQFDSERNGITPDQIFSQDNRPFWWRCEKGHQWKVSPNSRAGQTGDCPYCTHRRASPEYNLKTQFPWIAEEWVEEKNGGKPTDYLPFSEKEAWWRCHFHHDTIWKSKICYRTMGRTSNCPLCKKEQNISFPEQAVYYYLQILFPDAKNRLKIEGWEVDIFLPTLNLAIEYDGYYYHKGLISTETEEKKEQAMREARIEILRIKEHTQKQPTPAVDNVLWQLVPKNYKKYLFVEDLMKRLIAWLNERYHLCLVTRPDIQRDSQNIMSGYISRRKENNLTQEAPELVNEWHPTRNGTITPDLVSVTANKKYWWMCSKGHEWQSSVYNRMRGNNCPYCSGKRVSRETSLAAQNRDLAKLWHPTKNGELTPWHVTPGSGKEVWWQCKRGHEWQMSVSDGSRGNRCPYCSHHRVSEENALSILRPALAFEWNYDKNPTEWNPNTVSYSSSKKVWWKCKAGHEWQEKVSNRTYLGLKCPYCSGRRVTPEGNLAALHPRLAAEWHPAKNGAFLPEQFRPKSNRKVWWRCSYGHEWEAQISARTGGTDCPYCAGKRVWEKNSLAYIYPHIARQWHPNKNAPLTPHDVAANSDREVRWQCQQGHEWKRKIAYEIKNNGCPYCNGRLPTKETSLAGARPDLALEWHPNKNLPLSAHDVTLKSRQRVWWKCPKGHEWQMNINTRVSGIGNCPYCMGKRVCKENSLATLSPHIAVQWHPEKNEALTPDQVTNHSSNKAWWLCEKGHEWQAVIRTRTLLGAGCPVCAGKVAAPDYNLVTEFPAIAEEWDFFKNKCAPEAFRPYSNKIVWWRCRRCGEGWQAKIIDRTREGRACRNCTNKSPKKP